MILVAGGAGYIGAHITKKLHDRGYETLVFDNFSTGHTFVHSNPATYDVS